MNMQKIKGLIDHAAAARRNNAKNNAQPPQAGESSARTSLFSIYNTFFCKIIPHLIFFT